MAFLDDCSELEADLFDYVEDGPGQVVATFTETNAFEPAPDGGLCRGVSKFFNADDEDRLDR